MPADPKHNPDRNPAVLVEVTRGPIVELAHFGVIAVSQMPKAICLHGRATPAPSPTIALRASRSWLCLSSKPGAADHFGFTEREIAIICGSHGGEDIHVETVLGILDKIGCRSRRPGLRNPHAPGQRRSTRHAGARRTAQRPPQQLLGQARRYAGPCPVSWLARRRLRAAAPPCPEGTSAGHRRFRGRGSRRRSRSAWTAAACAPSASRCTAWQPPLPALASPITGPSLAALPCA